VAGDAPHERTDAQVNEVTELAEREREQALRKRTDAFHARLRAEFEQTCRAKADDDLPWLTEYIADELAHLESKTTASYPDSYRYLVMAREVVGLELVRRGLTEHRAEPQSRVA
jgi:hypothetical protein